MRKIRHWEIGWLMNILGISAFYHDSAAALVQDGRIVAAAQEERFTRIKHDSGFPSQAATFCLQRAGITAAELDHVVFYDKPLRKFERMLETFLAVAPGGFRQFHAGIGDWLKRKLHLPREMDKALGKQYRGRYVFTEHHESHAASAFFPSPFEKAAIVTIDGVGEWATASVGIGRSNRIDLTHELRFPHSLGLLYSAFTYYCGFKVNSGEYKLMGLAPYGEPKYVELMLEKLIDLRDDGSLRLDLSYFPYCRDLVMVSPKLSRLLGGPPRKPESPITQREMDIAASIQKVTEKAMMNMARFAHEVSGGCENLCLAGGVALNCVGNGMILREGPFRHVWIQPAAGDAGGALGAALFTWHQLLDNPRQADIDDSQGGSLLGPNYETGEIVARLDEAGAVYHHIDDERQLIERVAGLLAEENVVGFFQGRMEFGPRALGSRSILGDARSEKMQSIMNLKIKFRESFRPFAPSVLAERAADYFELQNDQPSPYMLLVAPVREAIRMPDATEQAAGLTGLDRLKVNRSRIPGVTHVDFSARVQTVDAGRHGRYYKLIKEFERLTGDGVIINTSFNIRGEPIVCTPQDAYRCFMATNMDVLVLENVVLLKSEQPEASRKQVETYISSFQLD